MNDSTGAKLSRRIRTICLEFGIAMLHLVGHIPSHFIRRFFYRIGGMKIGRGSTVHMGARFYDARNIVIGKDSIIGEQAILDGRDSLIIGDHVAFATGVMIYNAQHAVDDENFKAITKPVKIEDYVFIGPRSIILPGVTVKKGAIVAAGAVVSKDVAEYTVVAGVPAAPIRERKITDPKYKLGRAAWFR